MPSYLSPNSFQTPNSFQASGALGGFLAGMNQDYANQITNRGLRDSDLEFAIRQLAQQKEQSDLAVTQADNANKILAAGVTHGLYDSGAKKAEAEAITGANTAQAKEKTSAADVQDKLNAMSLYSQMGAEADQMWGNQAQPMNPNYVSWWQSWKDKLAPYAPKMPSLGDNGDLQLVQQQRQAAINNIPQMQALAQLRQKGENEQKVAQTHAQAQLGAAEIAAGSRENVANTQAASRTDVANILVNKVTNAQQQLSVVIAKADKDGWTPETAGHVKFLVTEMERDKEYMKLNRLMGLNDPSAISRADQQAEANAEALLKSLPGYVRATQGQSTGGGMPPSTPAALKPSTPQGGGVNYKGKTYSNPEDMLKANPDLADAYDQQYGKGSAAKVLGK